MKKFALPLLFSIALVWTSCGGGDKTPGGKADSDSAAKAAKTDSVVISPELKALSDKFKDGSWPFKTDSAMNNNITKRTETLSGADVKMLAVNWYKQDGIYDPNVKDFCTIDSVKAKGTYTQYCEKLDLGMTQYAGAYPINKLTIDPHNYVLVWGVWTSSVEACPSSDEKSVCYTIVHDGKPTESFLLGRNTSGADAPVWMDEVFTGQLNQDGSLSLESRSTNDDGAGEITKEHAKYAAKIQDGKLTAMTVSKDKPVIKKYQVDGDE